MTSEQRPPTGHHERPHPAGAATDAGAGLDCPPIRSFHHADHTRDELLAAKGSSTVSVCLPARNEEATVGRIVEVLVRDAVEPGLVDELVVIDDHSVDATAQVARDAGARVVDAGSVLPEFGRGHGKGEVLWKSLHVTHGDLLLWCDADLSDFSAHLVTGLLGPLLCEPDVELVKGFYHRPEADGVGGGRVTELVARPLLSLLFPALAGLYQPLSGEYGGRRSVLERLPFVQGYGVEVGILLHYLRQRGTTGLVQVDLQERRHRNRPLEDLGPQAMAVAQTILRHAQSAGLHGPEGTAPIPAVAELLRPGRPPHAVDVSERPPMIEVAAYLELLRDRGVDEDGGR
jgi:glucosyl-3-phosphoglycerate synthase